MSEMKRYRVTVDRTERIQFELDAIDEQDAENRYLNDGEEVDSETLKLDVVWRERLPEDI